MDLWIRSQDKETLKKINDIEIDYLNFKKYSYTKDIESKGEYSIRGNGETLGQYKTKEKALEVLDEIQNILKPRYIVNTSSIKPDGNFYEENGIVFQKYNANAKIEKLSTFVYEMPEE